MGRKCLVAITVLLFVFLFQLVSAEMLLSNVGVQYEQKILDEFAIINGTNKSFVPIIIELKDFSKANDLLSNFSKDDIQDVAIRNLSNIIGLDLTEEAFFKLIQDDRVKTVYYDRPMYLSKKQNFVEKISIFLLILLILILVLLIFYLIMKKKRKR